jgi:pyrroline-5-carboxylate reductase
MTKIAFLGAGRMASAMVGGLLTKGAAAPADLACTSGPDDTAQQLSARTGIAAHTDLAALLAGATPSSWPANRNSSPASIRASPN